MSLQKNTLFKQKRNLEDQFLLISNFTDEETCFEKIDSYEAHVGWLTSELLQQLNFPVGILVLYFPAQVLCPCYLHTS